MPSLTLTHVARRAMVVAGMTAIISAVACSDETTAPRSVATISESGPQATILPARTLVTVRIKDVWGSLITDKAPVKFFAGADSGVLYDNSANDKDMTVGIITVALPWSATFKACLYMDTPNFAINVWASYCNSAAGNASTVDLGSLLMRRFPMLSINLQDMYGNVVTSAKVTVTAPPNDGFQKTAQDGGAGDAPVLADGKITMKLNRPGTYTWCETVAPSGYLLPQPACGTIDVYWDVGTAFIIKHSKKIIIVDNPF